MSRSEQLTSACRRVEQISFPLSSIVLLPFEAGLELDGKDDDGEDDDGGDEEEEEEEEGKDE